MPVPDLDRTDAYRVKGRGGRIALALAGITGDGWFCGLVGLVAVTSTALVQETCVVLLGFQ